MREGLSDCDLNDPEQPSSSFSFFCSFCISSFQLGFMTTPRRISGRRVATRLAVRSSLWSSSLVKSGPAAPGLGLSGKPVLPQNLISLSQNRCRHELLDSGVIVVFLLRVSQFDQFEDSMVLNTCNIVEQICPLRSCGFGSDGGARNRNVPG